MITTFNGCYRSEIKVQPKNWNTVKASVNSPWRINYRFYDPAFKDHPKLKKGKQVKILGMNHFANREERQAFTRRLIEREKREIDVLGYNPITKVFMAPAEVVDKGKDALEITPETPFIIALETAFIFCIYSEEAINLIQAAGYEFKRQNNKVIVYKDGHPLDDSIEEIMSEFIEKKNIQPGMVPGAVAELKCKLKYFSQSAILLKKDQILLKDIRRKDITAVIDNCRNLTVTRTINKRVIIDGKQRIERHDVEGKMVAVKVQVTNAKVWNDKEFNQFRKAVSILYSELVRQDVIEFNPVEKIPKKDTTPEDPDQAKRKVLTPEEQRRIHMALIIDLPTFHRFVHIFYHSGARITEIMRLQGKNVDMAGQRFKILTKKRKKPMWVWKTIKDVALPYWQEIMKDCSMEDFVFAKGLKPGPKSIRVEQVGRRWRRHIKKKLGIPSGVYDLKHLHTTEVINELEKLQAELKIDPVAIAAEHNSHTSTAMVVQIYDVDADKREHRKVKGLKNTFAG